MRHIPFLISIAEAAPEGAKVGVKAGVLDGIINASPVVQLLLLLLIGLSVVSWAIIFMKRKQIMQARESNSRFSDQFWKAKSLESVFERLDDHPLSGMARVFKAAFMELQRIAEGSESNARLSGIDNLERTLRTSIDNEVSAAESRLGFLATVGSTAPFIGLLGTVLGIMTSFSQIAASGSASLAVVAPGISEALFATAIGLFAALPAVAAYNYFISQIRRLEMDLNCFGADFLNITKRNFFKGE